MSDPWAAAAPTAGDVETTIVNPDDWAEFAAAIEQRTGLPPVTDLATLTGWVTAAVQLLTEVSDDAAVDILRTDFVAPVVAQLGRFGTGLAGTRPRAIKVRVLGAPPVDGDPILRLRVDIDLIEADGRHGSGEHFWDVQLGGNSVVVAATTTCPACGAPLTHGALVCSYCGASARSSTEMPLLVTKLERLN